MLTKSGAKLLDFGLAKLQPTAPPGSVAVSAAPTVESPLTGAGSIVGTFQYMVPEQLEGQEADARTDIFAFGAVVYEMVTGQKAFEGKSQASLIAAILEHEPQALSTLQPVSPSSLDRLVSVCVAKDPDERWQATADVVRLLRAVVEDAQQPAPLPPGGTRSLPRWVAPLGAAALGTAVTLVAAWGVLRPAPAQEAGPGIRFEVSLPQGWEVLTPSFGASGGIDPSVPFAVSPDGLRLAIVGLNETGSTQVFVRQLASLDLRPLAGTQGATSPFWSPDGRSIGFFADGQLRRIGADGGIATYLCDASPLGIGQSATWSAGGVILFAGRGDGIQQVSDQGGVPTPVTVIQEGERIHAWPSFLPDGRRFIYAVQDASG